jgi:hypothetical protein
VKRSWLAVTGCLALALTGCGAAGAGAAGDAAAGDSAAGAASSATARASDPTATVATTAAGSASGTARGTASSAASAGASASFSAPAGFWEGSDSWPIPVTGSAPYQLPGVGGSYGGYLGMAGNWARMEGCHTGNFLAWSSTNSKQADANYADGKGIGTGVYWYMGGPGVDPHWNGTAAEAKAWGEFQAGRAIAAAAQDHVTYPILFMDIELPGVQPAPDNGWNDVYTSPCSGEQRSGQVTPALDRAEFNGFDDYLTEHSHYEAGVYSQPGIWAQIFGTGADAQIPHTYEWTYEPETASLADAPRDWCLKSGGCAEFFGGVSASSSYAVAWQWSGGGGVRNALGDFDQIDVRK